MWYFLTINLVYCSAFVLNIVFYIKICKIDTSSDHITITVLSVDFDSYNTTSSFLFDDMVGEY